MAETWSPVRPNGRFSIGKTLRLATMACAARCSMNLAFVNCYSPVKGRWQRIRGVILNGRASTIAQGRTDKDEGRMAVKAVLDLDDETIPAWQHQSMQRSLRTARARAHARSDRFVTAATRLWQEKGNTDFTVQDVVDRSKMSIRTFYKYFASKEDLLVAVYETVVARKAVPRLRKRIEKHRDPMLRLRAYVECLT